MKRKAILLLNVFICLTYCVTTQAQQVMRSTVGVSGNSKVITVGEQEYLVQQSVGQASVIGTFTNSFSTLQGFIQPPLNITSVISSETTLQAGIFPNPFKSILNVSFENEIKTSIDVLIYDVMGRVVFTKQYPAQQRIVLDLEFLSTAQYLMVIQAENKTFKANILKN